MPFFLFTDIEDSTQKWDRYAHIMPGILKIHDDILSSSVISCGGKIVKHTGDGIFAVFEKGNPIEACLEIQKRIGSQAWDTIGELRVRAAIHYGDAETRGNDYFGPSVNRCARVMSLAWGGQILITPEALSSCALPQGAVTKELGTYELKGLTSPQRILGVLHPSVKWQQFPPPKASSARYHKLPEYSNPYFGRAKEKSLVKELLFDGSRGIITLLGPGGMGKSRLSSEIAHEVSERYIDGAIFVPLAGIKDPGHIPLLVANTLDYTFYTSELPEKQVISFLKNKKMLVVFDNFEHVAEGAEFLYNLSQECCQLDIIVTSRARLGLENERVIELDGLATDGVRSEALELFLQRASKFKPAASFSGVELADAAGICRLLFGSPLAIELAVIWLRVIDTKELYTSISGNIKALSAEKSDLPERQRSIRAVFDYSWNLLTDREKEMFRKISIFVGGFTRDAAIHVVKATVTDLMTLSDRSLIRRKDTAGFTMHELLRQFAREKLEHSPEELAMIRREHCGYFLSYIKKQGPMMHGLSHIEILNAFGESYNNIRLAWEYAMDNRLFTLLKDVVSPLFTYFEQKNHYVDGLRLYQYLSPGLSSSKEPDAMGLYSNILVFSGILMHKLGHDREASMDLTAGIAIYDDLGMKNEAAYALTHLGLVKIDQCLYDEAEIHSRRALGLYKAENDRSGAAFGSMVLGLALLHKRNIDEAEKYALYAAGVFNEAGAMTGSAWAELLLGQIAVKKRDLEKARHYLEQALVVYRKNNNKADLAWALNALADVERLSGNYEEAKRVCLEGLAMRLATEEEWGQTISFFNLGLINHLNGDFHEALRSHMHSMNLSIAGNSAPMALKNLVCIARALVRTGSYGAALLPLAYALNSAGTAEKYAGIAGGLLEEISGKIGPDTVLAVTEKAKKMELREVCEEVVKEL